MGESSAEKMFFYATASFAVLFLGWVMFSSASAVPVANPIPGNPSLVPTASGIPGPTVQAGEQVVSVRALSTGGYDKREITVKAGIPVRFDFSADTGAGCGRQLILDGFNVQLVSRSGETQTATFTPTKAGDFGYHCGMYMFQGTMHVVL